MMAGTFFPPALFFILFFYMEAIMTDSLRYYIAHNGGLKILQPQGSSIKSIGEFFQGKTLEHLIGCTKKPEVVFAAVAFDGGYRTDDAGKTWTKIMDGD